VFRPHTLVSEGLKLVDGDFAVERCPLQTRFTIPGMGEVVFDVPGQSALVRPPLNDDPEPRVLGIVSHDYELIQHLEVAKALDPLVSRGWALETLGILHEGAQFFSTFAAGGFKVNEDDIEQYWIVSEHKGLSSIQIFSAHTRVVCANTYRVAESQALTNLSIPHFRGAKQELDWVVQVLAAAEQQTKELQATLEHFGKTHLLQDQVTNILEKVYPLPPTPRKVRTVQELRKANPALELDRATTNDLLQLEAEYVQKSERVIATRDTVWERMQVFNLERSDYADTSWALWNSVTEVENFKSGKGRGVSTLFGGRADTMERCVPHAGSSGING
jgi:hypothetical protein